MSSTAGRDKRRRAARAGGAPARGYQRDRVRRRRREGGGAGQHVADELRKRPGAASPKVAILAEKAAWVEGNDPVWGPGKLSGVAVQWQDGKKVAFWPPDAKGAQPLRVPAR